jgi:hypothetical protein
MGGKFSLQAIMTDFQQSFTFSILMTFVEPIFTMAIAPCKEASFLRTSLSTHRAFQGTIWAMHTVIFIVIKWWTMGK